MSDSTKTPLESLVAVDIATFRNVVRNITFDVFIKLSDQNVAHVFSRSTGIDYKRLAQYLQKGVKELYIKKEDFEAYKKFVSRSAHDLFSDPSISKEEKIAILLNITEQNMAEIFSQFSIQEETAASTQKLIHQYVDIMTSSPDTLAMILRLVSHGDYLYFHSIAVAIFSMFIAKATGQFNQRVFELVGMGGFLHDIGCTQLPKEIVCSPTEFTQVQWDEMKSHTQIGLRMIENTPNIPEEVRFIVYQHHEEPSGNGYPNNLRGSTIYFPAKVVAVADAFSALISKRPFRPAYTVPQAIHILEKCKGKHDPELIKLLSLVFLKNVKKAA